MEIHENKKPNESEDANKPEETNKPKGTIDSKIAIFAAILAFFGAVAGTLLTGSIQKHQWEREINYRERQEILGKRLDLLGKTSLLLNKSSYAEMLNKEIEYWQKVVDLNKAAILLSAKNSDGSDSSYIVKSKEILDGFRQARTKLIMLTSEYSSTIQLNAIYFGSKTRNAIKAIESNKNWWEAKKDTKEALLEAMYEELTVYY